MTSMDEATRRVLADLRAELEAIRRTCDIALETLAKLGAGFGPASEVAPRAPGPMPSSVRQVRDVLPAGLLGKFTIVDQGDGLVTIKTEWLERDVWARVDRKVKSMGGRWIPDGKNSRWEVHVPEPRS